MPISLIAGLIVLIFSGGWVFTRFYMQHMFGENAPEQSVNVTILDKQVIDIENTKPGQEDQEYWIYVQKGTFGPKREFQVGTHYYHALNPGDKGKLTYQGVKFLHFAMSR